MPALSEQLTAQFYEWEILGRGWLLGEEPIELEPPFTPFFGHYPTRTATVDDGIHHTLLSKAFSFFKNDPPLQEIQNTPIQYQPFLFENDNDLTTFKISIPKKIRIGTSETERFLTMLSYCTSPISFELIGEAEKITIQYSCRSNYASYLKSQLHTYFPEITVLEEERDISKLLSDDTAIATVDFGLQEEFVRPLGQMKNAELDSFTGIFSILDHLRPNERIVFQVLFNGVINPWEPSILRSVSDGKKGSFFSDSPEMPAMAKEKISTPLFAVAIRVLTQAEDLDDAFALLTKLSFLITMTSRSVGNSLIPLGDAEYTIEQRVEDILYAESHRLGMLLNVKELATFVHLPTFASKKLFSSDRKTKAASGIRGTFLLGLNEHNGATQEITVSNEQRLKHTHIIGATGTGKSTLMLNMISQDIKAGNGVAVLDPHGDLVDNVLQSIPEDRIDDVVVIDPSNTEFPLSFNILHAQSEIEKEILSADLVAAFRRLSTSWGDQMTSVLSNAILAFLESRNGGTLIDLRRFLIEKEYRQEFLKTVSDPHIQYYWQKQYHLLKTNSIGPILTRLDSFLRSRIIRNMVAQKKGLDFEKILNSKKILLIKLSQGLIGTENSYMLGTFIVSKIHQAAFARQALITRNDFFMYVDEFQHFITPSMSAILSGARKYHVGLILAHQDLQQLQKYDSELSNAVISNAGTRICFRVGDTDAKRLADGFSFFEAQDLQNLNTGEAIARIEKSENDFSLSTIPLQPADNKNNVQRIITLSQEKYCTPKDIVESQLFKDLDLSEERKFKTSPEAKPPAPIKIIEQDESVDSVVPSTPEQPQKPLSDDKTIKRIIKKKQETQHRYLQNLIKKMAEARGYKAILEASIPQGNGKVDVLLERDKETIACEVSITTDVTWELHNIQKCLGAGYELVISCQPDPKALALLQAKASNVLSNAEIAKVKFFSPEELFTYLDERTMGEMQTESMMKGYRVKVSYDTLTSTEMTKKRETVAKVVAESLRKMK